MYKNQKPIDQPLQTKHFTFLAPATNLIEALCRQKNHQNKKDAFQRLHNYSLSLSKRSNQFAKILNKITTLKELQNKKVVFGVFFQLKISEILAKRQKLSILKEKSRSSASIVIGNLMGKNLKTKISLVFATLKTKTILIRQRSTFKTLNLMNSIKSLELKLLKNAFKMIRVKSFDLLAKYKRCFVIQSFYTKKRIQNLTLAIDALKNNKEKAKDKPKFSSVLQQAEPQEADILKQLQEQKKQLEAQLNQLKNTNRTNLKVKQSELQKIQSEYESLRFSLDVMTQENIEMVENINEREKLASQAENRKKQSDEALSKKSIPSRPNGFNQHDMWKSVFDNLMLYLYRLKAGYDREAFSLEKLLERMTEPLISLSVYAQKSQLLQENEVLKDLLESYRAAFNKSPSQEISQKQICYPLEILNRQRRYLYQALNCLTRWGTTEAQGLQEIKTMLEKLKQNQSQSVSVAN